MIYKYELIRSHRKGISISISSSNNITVRCPWELSRQKLEEFLDSKERWIEKNIERNAVKLAANDDVIEYRSIYFNGRKLPLIVADKNEITSESVYVKKIDNIAPLYKKHCAEEFFKCVDELARLTKLMPASVNVRSYKGRWGCCDGKNNLTFNYKLFMLPPHVQRYVIIHELCHTLCHNHSAAFWKLVSEFEPDFKHIKKQLSDYDFIASLY